MKARIISVMEILLVCCALATTTALVIRSVRWDSNKPVQGMIEFEGWREDLEHDRRIGSANAPYRLVVWVDYQCPACKRFESEVHRMRTELRDSLSVVYRHFPLESHPLAFDAAVMAECARAQGRFEDMHLALFFTSLNESLPIQSLIAASGVGDEDAFRACIADQDARAEVRTDMARGRMIGIRGTPAVQIGTRIGTGGRMAEEIIPLLRDASAGGGSR